MERKRFKSGRVVLDYLIRLSFRRTFVRFYFVILVCTKHIYHFNNSYLIFVIFSYDSSSSSLLVTEFCIFLIFSLCVWLLRSASASFFCFSRSSANQEERTIGPAHSIMLSNQEQDHYQHKSFYVA